MSEVFSLSSGSDGNCTVIKQGEEIILIDCGLSFKRLKDKMAERSLHTDQVTGIFITHEHADHISGVRVVGDKLNCPVFTNRHTGLVLQRSKRSPQNLHFFENGTTFNHGAFIIEPFSVPHDGVDTVAYIVHANNRKIAVATDFGSSNNAVKQRLKDCDLLLLEANHDKDMLINCTRPWHIKQRILSAHGHLSNDTCLEILSVVLHKDMKQLILGHVSKDANDYSLVYDLAQKHLDQCGMSHIPLHIAKQDEVSPAFIL